MTAKPRDHRELARVALLRRLLLTSTRVLPLLAPYANRSLRAGLHRRIASDLEAAFLLLARERLAGRRTRPLKTITTAERELRHAGVPDGDCDCRRLAGDCARLATRAAVAEGSGRVSEADSRQWAVDIAVAHASVSYQLAELFGHSASQEAALARHRQLVALQQDLVAPDPLPIPPPAVAAATAQQR